MLKKLFKYEYKATAKWMLPTYAFVLVLSVINMFFVGSFDKVINSQTTTYVGRSISSGISMFFFTLYFVSLVAMCVASVIVAAYRFYTNLLSNQGYISLTLPVKIYEHIIVKLLIAIMWFIKSTLLGILSFFIIFARTGLIGEMIKNYPEFIRLSNFALNNKAGLLFTQIIILIILSMFSTLLTIYTAMSIGQLSNKHKIGMSILAYIGIYIVMQIFEVMFGVGTIFNSANVIQSNVGYYVTNTLYFACIYSLSVSTLFFFITKYILTKKINLQ